MPAFIELESIGYVLPGSRVLFENLSARFGQERVGIVGRNGIGKSTLLRILVGETSPSSGQVTGDFRIGYMPQQVSVPAELTGLHLLGVREQFEAAKRVEAGSDDPQDIETSIEFWSRQADIERHLDKLKLSDLNLDDSLAHYSGGEITRLRLLAAILAEPTHLLLDEPTNHLDLDTRTLLYDLLLSWPGGAIVVSHDRMLLDQMHRIAELSPTGLKFYSGGYAQYEEARAREKASAERAIDLAERQVRLEKKREQQEREKQERRAASGRRSARRTGKSALEIGAAKERSSKTSGNKSARSDKRREDASKALSEATKNRPETLNLKMSIKAGDTSGSRPIVSAKDVSHTFPGHGQPVFKPVTFSLVPGERLVLEGPSGAGKSTLLKIVKGDIQPASGDLENRARKIAYLDQDPGAALAPDLSVLENFKAANPTATENEARTILARYLFRNTDAMKPVSVLSGGEKLRAALACALSSTPPAELLLLDEPTNNLDLASIAELEAALSAYAGAIIVASHDTRFIDSLDPDQVIRVRR